MRILLVADAVGEAELEPTPSWLASLTRGLAERGHRMTVLAVAPQEPWRTPHDPTGVTVWRPTLDTLERAFAAALARGPEVVHVSATMPLPPRVVESLAGLPTVLDLHDASHACAAGDLRQRPARRACAHAHGYEGCGACAGWQRLQAMELRVPLARAAWPAVAHTRLAAARLGRAMAREVERLPLGVDLERWRPADAVASAAPRVLLLGPLHGEHASAALDLLVSVYSRRPDLEWWIPGRTAADPDAHARLLSEARRHGLADRLHVTPALDPGEQPARFAACAAAVQLGGDDWDSGLGLRCALASGLPVIAPDAAPWNEWVRPGVEGLLAAPEDPAAMASALVAVLANDSVRAGFADRARLAAFEQHDLSRALAAHEELYRRAHARGIRRAA